MERLLHDHVLPNAISWEPSSAGESSWVASAIRELESRTAWHEFQHRVAALNLPRLLRAEMIVQAYRGPRQLRGCGMLIANAPSALQIQLGSALVWLWQRLSDDHQGGTRVEWMSGP